MDPNVALAKVREVITRWNSEKTFGMSDVADMMSHFEWLDEWLSKGGFLPQPWDHHCSGNHAPKRESEK